jgi:hypothetical protein
LLFLLSISLAILSVLCLNFRAEFSIPVINVFGILMGITLNM